MPARVFKQRRCGANNRAKTITGKARRIGLDRPGVTGRKKDLTAGGTPNSIRRTPFLRHGCLPATAAVRGLPQDTESFFFQEPQLTPRPGRPETRKKRNGIGTHLKSRKSLVSYDLRCVPFNKPLRPRRRRTRPSGV